MTTIASRKQKGRKLQQTVAKALLEKSDKYGLELKAQDVASRPMGSTGCDVMLSSWASKWMPFSFEAGNMEAWPTSLWNKYDQGKRNTKKDEITVLVIKKNHKEPLVLMSLTDFNDYVVEALIAFKQKGVIT
jgi:hypothetical protein